MLSTLRLSGITVPLEWVVLAVLIAAFAGLYIGCAAMADALGGGDDDGTPR